MRRFMYVAATTLMGVGLMSAAQVPCSINTAAFYQATFTSLANGCTIGPLVFWAFNATPHGAFPSGPGTGPATDADLIITPVSDANGFGFDFTSAAGWIASTGGSRDFKLPFRVGCTGAAPGTLGTACLTRIFLSIKGEDNFQPGYDRVTETYCLGGTTAPPVAPCPPPFGTSVTQDTLFIFTDINTPTTQMRTDAFSPVVQISVNDDMEANAQATMAYSFSSTNGPGATLLFNGFLRDVSPASYPIPGFTGFVMPNFTSLSPCDLISNSSGELDCRAPTVHSGVFYFVFDYGAFPNKIGPFTGSGFMAPDGATPGLGTVNLLNGVVVRPPFPAEATILSVSTRFTTVP